MPDNTEATAPALAKRLECAVFQQRFAFTPPRKAALKRDALQTLREGRGGNGQAWRERERRAERGRSRIRD